VGVVSGLWRVWLSELTFGPLLTSYAMDTEARAKRKAGEEQVASQHATPSRSASTYPMYDDIPSRPISSTSRVVSSSSNASRSASTSIQQSTNAVGAREAPIEIIDDEDDADDNEVRRPADGSAGGRRVRTRMSGGGTGDGSEPIVVD
jgi:hypothetical protein